MEAIVLAGGFGTRLRAVVPDVSKPMAPIAGKPFLEILLGALSRKGFTRAILSLGFMSETITGHFGNRFADMDLDYMVEEVPLGTGGAVRLALTKCVADHVYVFNGDTYLDLEVAAVEAHWQAHRLPIIVGREVPDTSRFGRLLTEAGMVTGFAEKGLNGFGLINAGCYVMNRGQLDAFAINSPFSLESDYFVQVVASAAIEVFVTRGHFIDIGIPEDYARAQSELGSY